MTVPKRFSVLRLIGTLFKTFAWIVLVLAIALALFVGLMGPLLQQTALDIGLSPELLALSGIGGIGLSITLLASGLIVFFALFAGGERIHLQLAIEENTRLTAALLLRLDETQPATPVDPGLRTYYGEVID